MATKREMFTAIREEVADNAKFVEFLDKQIEALNKKNGTHKPSKEQLLNEEYRATVLNMLANEDAPLRIADFMKRLDEAYPDVTFSNQKVTQLLLPLVRDGRVVRSYVKKVAYYSLSDGTAPTVEGE
jgi:hypothetical protein